FMTRGSVCSSVFCCNEPATSEIYTLSLHDALPILRQKQIKEEKKSWKGGRKGVKGVVTEKESGLKTAYGSIGRISIGSTVNKQRSEEHTSELQSRFDLVCRLLLEKKKEQTRSNTTS